MVVGDYYDDGNPTPSQEGFEEDEEGGQGFSDTNSACGAASLNPREMSRAIGAKEWQLSQKLTNMLNAQSRDPGESLLLKVRSVVERLGLDPSVREGVIEKAEVLAARMKRRATNDEDSPRPPREKEAALAAVIRVMHQSYGWSIDQVARKISEADRRIVAVDDLKVTVVLGDAIVTNGDSSGGVSAKVGGEERGVKVLDNGGSIKARRLLRIRAYATDDGKLLEVSGASICASLERRKKEGADARAFCPSDPRRLEVLDAHSAVVKLAGGGGSSFEALKLMERVELGRGDSKWLRWCASAPGEPPLHQGANTPGLASQERVKLLLRRYRTEKLPLTEYLAKGAGALMKLRMKYCERFAERFDPACVRERLKRHTDEDDDPLLRSPRLLAHEAIRQADEEVFASLPEHHRLTVRRLALERNLHGSYVGIKGFLVESELKVWEES